MLDDDPKEVKTQNDLLPAGKPSLLGGRRVAGLTKAEIEVMRSAFAALEYNGTLEFDESHGSRTRFVGTVASSAGGRTGRIIVGADIFPGENVINPNSLIDYLPAAAHEVMHFRRWENGYELSEAELEYIDEAMTSLQAICYFNRQLNYAQLQQLASDALQRLKLYVDRARVSKTMKPGAEV